VPAWHLKLGPPWKCVAQLTTYQKDGD
jgi:hypothetical protein